MLQVIYIYIYNRKNRIGIRTHIDELERRIDGQLLLVLARHNTSGGCLA